MSNTGKMLVSGFLESARRFPDRPALSIQQASLSYAELAERAAAIGATLQHQATGDGVPLAGLFGHRSFTAFSGVLGILMSGGGYVPLNPAFPAERTAGMIDRARLDQIVVESQSLEALTEVLPYVNRPLRLVVPEAPGVFDLSRIPQRHVVVTESAMRPAAELEEPPVDPDRLAYLLFTSGSTGRPKGVMVTQRNVMHFVSFMASRYEVTEHDRFSQTFDLTFDLSAFDMFVAWERGACVCCPTQGEKLFPGKYILSQDISIWFSVPSTAILMKKMKMLAPGKYPNLRYSLFCGEALPLAVAEAFQEAAPKSVLENLYGPTELTIACTLYRYHRDRSPGESELGVVPIGEPYPGMSVLVADDGLQEVPQGEPGELLMAGPQLSAGYWEDAEKTRAAFVVPPGRSQTYYRTGDRVKRSTPGGPLLYLGRVDNQIKVQGYRVELGEIEAAARDAADTDTAVAIGYPMGDAGAEGILVFIGPASLDPQSVKKALQARLPSYMHPSSVTSVAIFPLNANGKVDRAALLASHLQDTGA